MSANTPETTLTCSFAITASAAANAQIFATIVDDLRKTGVTDYQLTQNIASQIVDAYTIGSPAVDGQIVVERNNGQEKRNLGLLSNLRNDITNNRVPALTRKPISMRPGDKVSVYIILSVANGTTAQTDTLYLTITAVQVASAQVRPAQQGQAMGPSLGSIFGRPR